MRETANARSASKASVLPYLEMKRRQYRQAALRSLTSCGLAEQAGNKAAANWHWARYEEAATLTSQIDRQLKSDTVSGLSRLVAHVLR